MLVGVLGLLILGWRANTMIRKPGSITTTTGTMIRPLGGNRLEEWSDGIQEVGIIDWPHIGE